MVQRLFLPVCAIAYNPAILFVSDPKSSCIRLVSVLLEYCKVVFVSSLLVSCSEYIKKGARMLDKQYALLSDPVSALTKTTRWIHI